MFRVSKTAKIKKRDVFFFFFYPLLLLLLYNMKLTVTHIMIFVIPQTYSSLVLGLGYFHIEYSVEIESRSALRLHTTKNISPSPTLQFGGVFCIDVDQGSLINKKNEK